MLTWLEIVNSYSLEKLYYKLAKFMATAPPGAINACLSFGIFMEEETKDAKPDRDQQLQQAQTKRMRGHNKPQQTLSCYRHQFSKPGQRLGGRAASLCRSCRV